MAEQPNPTSEPQPRSDEQPAPTPPTRQQPQYLKKSDDDGDVDD